MVVPGTGYIILGKRVVFGWLLVVGGAASFVWSIVEPSVQDAPFLGSEPSTILLGAVAFTCATIAFGYDAYQLARGK